MFNKVIMNPPYSGSLHLKILDTVIKNCPKAEIVNLSPIRWLQDPLAEYKKSSDWKKFKDIRERISSLDVVKAKEACEIFSMIVSTDLGIYTIGGNKHYEDIRNKLALKLYLANSHFDEFELNKKDGWRVRVSIIDNCKAGGSSTKDKVRFQRLLAFKDGMKDDKPWYDHFGKCGWSKQTDYIPYSIPFGSEAEAENFISVMSSSKFGRYYWLNLQQDVNVLPCFFIKLDYSKPWTDEDLYEYFSLTDEEIKEIECSIKS